ncbi:MAG TPA: S9 family peptidase [Pseudoxanthomonas sp.]|nr:S9 family peptidase [Pseudoxanthomonas sp.]
MKQHWIVLGWLAIAPWASLAAKEPIPVADFVKHPTYSSAKISPTGEYLAMTVDRGDQDVLTVLRTKDMSIVKVNLLPEQKSIGEFYWTSPQRIIFNSHKKVGSFAQPFNTGEWYAVNADGSQPRPLVFYGTRDVTQRSKTLGNETFSLLDTLPNDDQNVIMSVSYPRSSEGAGTEVVMMDTLSGRRKSLARAPRDNCEIALDQGKQPRFAVCYDSEGEDGGFDENTELYRLEESRKWTLLNRSKSGGKNLRVVGAAPDGRIYALQDDKKAPAAFGTIDPATGSFTKLFQDPVAEVSGTIRSADREAVLAVYTEAGAPKVEMVDEDHPDSNIYLSMANAFPGQFVDFSSATKDGKQIIVSVRSDTNPGELYLYDRDTGKARFLMQNRKWLDKDRMASVKPFSFTASDGKRVHGYLTIPKDSSGRDLPMIVNPHGGPIGPRDDWFFNPEAQLLASRGYLVLQVNFRGSGGYGQAFQDAGHGEWGGKIQDDINEAARWAIKEGYANEDRICIYGGSFGGYSALMAPIRAPDLYKCAFGYVGVYDMNMMYKEGDVEDRESGLRYLRHTIGSAKTNLNAISPALHADKIKIPVFLAAGARDYRAAPEHTEAMRDALVKAGNPPEETIIQSGEMHGFYKEENRVNLYTKMLSFFARNIGGQVDVGAPRKAE